MKCYLKILYEVIRGIFFCMKFSVKLGIVWSSKTSFLKQRSNEIMPGGYLVVNIQSSCLDGSIRENMAATLQKGQLSSKKITCYTRVVGRILILGAKKKIPGRSFFPKNFFRFSDRNPWISGNFRLRKISRARFRGYLLLVPLSWRGGGMAPSNSLPDVPTFSKILTLFYP